jgi:hypothetical protein
MQSWLGLPAEYLIHGPSLPQFVDKWFIAESIFKTHLRLYQQHLLAERMRQNLPNWQPFRRKF